MKGRIIKSTGSWYNVLLSNGQMVSARTRGKLRLEGARETNPVAVGDFVEVLLENDNATIETIEIARTAGADTFVAGSAVYRDPNPAQMVERLRKLANAVSI